MRMNDAKYYSIGSLNIESDIPIPEFKSFEKNKVKNPNLIITETSRLPFIKRGERLERFFYRKEDTTLYIDYRLPVDTKLQISNLEGDTVIKFTKAYRKFTNFGTLINQIIAIKLIQNGLTFIQAAGLAHNSDVFLIIGIGGMGKTSVALSLAKTFKFMSDDTVIIDENGMAYSYGTGFGVSPHTVLSNTSIPREQYRKIRLKRLISRSNILARLLGKYLNIGVDERVNLPEGVEVSDKGDITNIFLLTQKTEKDEIKQVTTSVATKKIFAATMEMHNLLNVTHIAILLYFYLSPDMNLADIMSKREEIIKEAIRNAKCFELRAENIKKYPEMIKKQLQS